MTDLNHVDVIGRCVKQPDLVKKGPSGVSVLTFAKVPTGINIGVSYVP